MAKNLWYLGVAILIFAIIIMAIILFVTLNNTTNAERIALGVGLLACVITISIAIFNRKSEIRDKEIAEFKEENDKIKSALISKAEHSDLITIQKKFQRDLQNYSMHDKERYDDHKKADDDRYEEVKAIMEQSMGIVKESKEAVIQIQNWIMDGKIIKKEI